MWGPDHIAMVTHHPLLGYVPGCMDKNGSGSDDVMQFRAIPYAKVPRQSRFEHSVLCEDRNDKHPHKNDKMPKGYAFPHNFTMDDINGGGPYPGQAAIATDEFESLILHVNVPAAHFGGGDRSERLPVMVYIHGGGFVLGKIDAQHNTAAMVQQSIEMQKPVIGVNIQYRLGAFGFMATPDGGKNFGLWDQRNALLWIQKFIGDFGGDKDRVTLFGESAGSYSICCHMLSHPRPSGPLFNRVILQSGVIGPMMTPRSEKKAAEAFRFICKELGVEKQGEAAVEMLRGFSTQKLVDASEKWSNMGNSWGPVEDEEFFREKVTWDKGPELIGKCEWVDDIIVGNTGFEGQASIDVAKAMTPASFAEHLRLELSAEAANMVMKAYNISEGMDQNLFINSAMRWCGDTIFDTPNHALCAYLATATKKRVYRYIFDIRNPFPNAPYYQQAHHWVDVYFVFRTMQFRFPYQYLKDLSDKHAQLWIDFANGKAPWKQYKLQEDGDATFMVADERDGWVERTFVEHNQMSPVKFQRLHSLLRAWHDEKKGMEWLPLNNAALKQSAS